jgi:putative tricarboxylic transport membrane protein
VGFVGGEGFLPLKSRIRPLVMYTAEAPEWWPDAPTIADAGIKSDFVEGSQRGWVVATKLKNEQPDVYAVIEKAVERASQKPEAIEALKRQELATRWYGPKASNEAYLTNFKKMSQYVDLLR